MSILEATRRFYHEDKYHCFCSNGTWRFIIENFSDSRALWQLVTLRLTDNSTIILGETVLLSDGRIGEDNYNDIRRFSMAKPSIALTYVFVATVLNGKSEEDVDMLNTRSTTTSIDLG